MKNLIIKILTMALATLLITASVASARADHNYSRYNSGRRSSNISFRLEYNSNGGYHGHRGSYNRYDQDYDADDYHYQHRIDRDTYRYRNQNHQSRDYYVSPHRNQYESRHYSNQRYHDSYR